MNFLLKSTHSTPRSEARDMLRVDPSTKLRAGSERRFLPRFKNRGLAPSNVSKGFSIIEVLIALIILSVALLALAALMTMTTKNNSFGSHMTEASVFGQGKLEELRVNPWGNILSGNDQRAGSTGINYNRNWVVVSSGNLKTVTITIGWIDKINHQVRLVSVISQ